MKKKTKMDNETIDSDRLNIALGMLGAYQINDYTKQCDACVKELTVCERLGIATRLFSDNQIGKFAVLVAKHEGFTDMPSRACKGSNCHGCMIGQRGRCLHRKDADAKAVDRLTVRHKRGTCGG